MKIVATFVFASSQGQCTHSAQTKIPKIVATFVYASSQGQRTHSAWTNKKSAVIFPEEHGYIAGRARLYSRKCAVIFCNENNGHLRFCLQPRAAHVLRSDQNRRNGLSCDSCQGKEVESQSYVLLCSAYDKLRDGLDLTKQDDLIRYYREMLAYRDRKDSK